MNNYEKIETYLKHGLHVSVKDTEGFYQVISPVKDRDGYFRTSSWRISLEKSKQYIGEWLGYPFLKEACKNWTEITPFHLDFEPYPVGMKVKIVKIGMTTDIKEVKHENMYTLKNTIDLLCSHTELIPYFEEAPIEMTIKQIEEKLNITGLKIVN